MRIAAMGIVVGQDGSVLMIQRDDIRTWAPPGGSLDKGELPTDAVAREVEEETGYKVLPVRLVGLRFVPLKPWGYLTFVFRCLLRGGEATLSSESRQVGFVPVNPIEVAMIRLHRRAVMQAVTHSGGPPVWETYRMGFYDHIGKALLFGLVYPLRNLMRRFTGKRYVAPPSWHLAASTIIRDAEGKVLWIKRRDDGRWNLPHGGSQPLEPPWQTALRETREETGLEVRLTDLTGVYVKPEKEEMVFVFSAETISGTLTTGPESAEFATFSPGDEPETCLPFHVARVADAAAPRETTIFRTQRHKVG
ncbi:MAG: NUDIX domain-containing protein [Anaerolineae bacterium]|nr:NUDIX domain-containing protein [Anaerolineae bacterium]